MARAVAPMEEGEVDVGHLEGLQEGTMGVEARAVEDWEAAAKVEAGLAEEEALAEAEGTAVRLLDGEEVCQGVGWLAMGVEVTAVVDLEAEWKGAVVDIAGRLKAQPVGRKAVDSGEVTAGVKVAEW